MDIGSRLKNMRENKKNSQQEIADFLDISQKTYSNIESGKSTPSVTQLSKLSTLLDFDVLELLREEGITFNQSNNEFKDSSNGIVLKYAG